MHMYLMKNSKRYAVFPGLCMMKPQLYFLQEFMKRQQQQQVQLQREEKKQQAEAAARRTKVLKEIAAQQREVSTVVTAAAYGVHMYSRVAVCTQFWVSPCKINRSIGTSACVGNSKSGLQP